MTSEAAAELQNRFVEGDVNVLSCSTRFELGVDVGELDAVFMRNMPSSAANYIQRAGRAGRRTDSTAFALTFAQQRSHDLAHYREPWRMVSGKIMAPHFKDVVGLQTGGGVATRHPMLRISVPCAFMTLHSIVPLACQDAVDSDNMCGSATYQVLRAGRPLQYGQEPMNDIPAEDDIMSRHAGVKIQVQVAM